MTQTATGVIYGGRGLLRRSIRFLTNYMEEQGYRSVEDFIGLGLKYVIPVNKIDFQAGKVFAYIDAAKCTGCGRRTQHFCLATYLEDGVAKARIDDCMGCGACVAICPETAVILKNRT